MAKVLSLTILFFLAFQGLKAQTEKGSTNLGIILGAGTSTSKTISITNNIASNITTKDNHFTITPNFSYFIKEKLDLGTELGFGRGNSNYNSTPSIYTSSSNNYSASVYLRKYFLYENKIGIRTGPYLHYEYSNSKTEYVMPVASTFDIKKNIYSSGIRAALVYYPSKKIGLTAQLLDLGYSYYKQTTSQNETTTNNAINFNLIGEGDLSFGVFFVLGKK